MGIDARDLQPDRRVRWLWSDYLKGIDPDAEAATGNALICPG